MTIVSGTAKTWRERDIDRLTERFISRGVRPATARAWAEAEVPPDSFTSTNYTAYYFDAQRKEQS